MIDVIGHEDPPKHYGKIYCAYCGFHIGMNDTFMDKPVDCPTPSECKDKIEKIKLLDHKGQKNTIICKGCGDEHEVEEYPAEKGQLYCNWCVSCEDDAEDYYEDWHEK